MRRVLAPLSRVAEETSVAIILILHLNKSSSGNVLHRNNRSVGSALQLDRSSLWRLIQKMKMNAYFP